jgi:Nucleoside 2-deoxyribosyltransferase like
VFKPPAPVVLDKATRAVFLAGSIEMGVAIDWQAQLADVLPPDVAILNPRRDEWDASWRQSIDEPKFREQVEWELDGLDRADVIAMWFVPDTKSPITLLELGLHARGGKLVVGCPPGFWRRGNIEVVCARYAIPLHAAWDAFVADVTSKLCT